jgi:hypothetical protein
MVQTCADKCYDLQVIPTQEKRHKYNILHFLILFKNYHPSCHLSYETPLLHSFLFALSQIILLRMHEKYNKVLPKLDFMIMILYYIV